MANIFNTTSSQMVNQFISNDLTVGDTITTNTLVANDNVSADNLIIPVTTATSGQIIQNGVTQFHTAGVTNNTFIGTGSGNFTNVSSGNVGVGLNTLTNVSSGNFNVAIGNGAQSSATSGSFNLAVGQNAMVNVTGSENMGIGASSLLALTSGGRHVAMGNGALLNTATGSGNVGIGYLAGSSLNGGDSFNTYIGYNNIGIAGENNVTRIGSSTANTCYIGGIDTKAMGTTANLVGVTAGNLLGTNATTLVANGIVNTTDKYQISGEDVLTTSTISIKNGPHTATISYLGSFANPYDLPNKPVGSYVLATTSDLSSAAYFSRGVLGAPNITTTVAMVPTPMIIATTTNNVSPVNFTMGSNTLITYTGTDTIVAKVTGNVSLTSTTATGLIGLLIIKNSGAPEAIGGVTASIGTTHNLFADAIISLATNDTLEMYYYTDLVESIETRTLNFNAHKL